VRESRCGQPAGRSQVPGLGQHVHGHVEFRALVPARSARAASSERLKFSASMRAEKCLSPA
jgi:hypothetical protein